VFVTRTDALRVGDQPGLGISCQEPERLKQNVAQMASMTAQLATRIIGTGDMIRTHRFDSDRI